MLTAQPRRSSSPDKFRRCPTCGIVVAWPCRVCGLRPKPKPGSYALDAERGALAAAEISDAELVAVRQAAGVDYLPSPAEIVETAAEIREGWSDDERTKRATRWARVEWELPEWVAVELVDAEGAA